MKLPSEEGVLACQMGSEVNPEISQNSLHHSAEHFYDSIQYSTEAITHGPLLNHLSLALQWSFGSDLVTDSKLPSSTTFHLFKLLYHMEQNFSSYKFDCTQHNLRLCVIITHITFSDCNSETGSNNIPDNILVICDNVSYILILSLCGLEGVCNK
jgi:hypothetical protein